MIIVTSLSPGHSNCTNQHNAINSWKQFGQCYSMNNIEEMSQLKNEYEGIEFVETEKTIYGLVGKHLVSIYAMIEFAKDRQEDLFIINSDIIISHLPALQADGVTLFSRYDYEDSMGISIKFENGFDGFYIPNKFLNLFPFSVYAMGACYHDYVIALICIEKNIPVYYPEGKFCYHKLHKVQYSFQEYLDFGQYFRWHFKLDNKLTIPQVAASSLQKIKNNLIKY